MKKIVIFLISAVVIITSYVWFFNTPTPVYHNPFVTDYPEKDELTNEDYIAIQEKLRTKDISPLLAKLHNNNVSISTLQDFTNRCTRGLKQTLINPEKGQYPQKKLVKIGNGGDMCIVNCCPYDGVYQKLLESIVPTLEKEGFNGYFYYRIGGFPHPTKKEVNYFGVPYTFKIFMMLEAQKLGFNKVLWIDSAVLPVRDLTPVFEKIDKNDCFITHYTNHSFDIKYIFPETRQLLIDLTGTDIMESRHISTQVFGLKMDAPKTQRFIKKYYELLELGTPFLSCFPEEFVFASIIKPNQKEWPGHFINTYVYFQRDFPLIESSVVKDSGYTFYLRKH